MSEQPARDRSLLMAPASNFATQACAVDAARRAFLGRTLAVSAVAGLGLGGVIAAACAAQRDTLVFGLSTYPGNLAPFQNTGAAAGTVKLQVHRGLLDYDATGALRPALAERFVQEAPDRWSFALRQNARFHNGKAVTSEDVAYSIGCIVADKSSAYLKPEFDNVAKVEILDSLHFRLHLHQPNAVFGHRLASWSAPVVCADAAGDPTVGCGPYRIEHVERGSRIELSRFDRYFRPGRPRMPKLRFVAYPDASLRMAALESGDVDLVDFVPYPSMQRLGKDRSLRMSGRNGPFMYLLFNTSRPPFDDVRVRQAVAIAINRNDIAQAVFFGHGAPLETVPFPRDSPYTDASLAHYWKQDVARARTLLAQAGHANGFATTLLATSEYAMHEQTALVIQQNLLQVGIDAQLKLPNWGARVAQGRQGAYDMAVMGLAGEYNDPDALSPYLTGGKPAHTRSFGYQNAQLDALFAQGRAETEPARRRSIYAQAQRLALEQAPMVGLVWREQSYGMRADVEGFQNLPDFLTLYSALSLEDVALA